MRFNKKRIIAILVFLLLSFFMITFGNPVNNTAIVTRNVKFIDSYNDKLLADKKVELGKAVTAPTVPKHKDLVFINWYIKGTDTVANLNKILTNSIFVTKYAEDKNNNGIADDVDKYYTVKFIDGLDNSLLKTEKVLVGLDASAPVIPNHEGYTFGNWDLTFENVKKNIIVTALFNINSYNLKINYNYAKNNSEASPSYSNAYTYKSNYNVVSPIIVGYKADKLTVSGIIPANDVEVNVTYIANNNTSYKVEHYKEALDGSYKLVQTDNMLGETDTLTKAVAESYTGFTAKSFDQLNINGNGSTLVKIYYARNSYTLTYKVDETDYKTYTLKYEELITPEVKPSKTGYTFCGWSTIPSQMPANNLEITGSFKINKYILSIYYQNEYGLPMATPYINIVNYGSNYSVTSDNIPGYTVDKPIVSGIMPAGDKMIFVTYVANKNTPYKIEYYKNGLKVEAENKTGTTDTFVSIVPNLNKYPGYYYDVLNFNNWLADFIHGDGSTTLKVYYKAKTNTAYKVRHYTENLNGGYSLYATDNKIGTTDKQTSAQAKNISGFTVQSFTQKNINGDGSTVVEIYYTRNAYQLTFVLNNGNPDVKATLKFGESIIIPPLSKEGYTFKNWTPSVPSTMPASNATYSANWNINSYKLTINYKYSDESIAATKYEQSYNYNLGYSVTSPLVAGYRADILVVSGTIPANDVVVNVTYTANTDTAYKVKHYTENLDGSYSLIDTEDLTGTTNMPTNAVAKSLTGFTVQAFDQENINGNGSTVVEIHYSRNSYTLTFKPENGSVDITSTEKYGTSISAPTVTKEGYTFKSWTPSVPSTMPASNSTYTASWDINSYTVTYNLNPTADIIGASHSNALNVYNINTALYTISNATSTSDNFDGWFTTADNSGTQVTTLAGGSIGDVELYAHWSKKAYTVDFEENGGSSVLPLANVYYGSTIVSQTTTRTGFIFDDWYKEETLANKWLFATDTVTKDLTLYANWRAENYNLVFNINDSGVVNAINPSNPDKYTIADNITFNNASSKSHTFLGWFTTADNTGIKVTGITAGTTTGNQTYYAHWEIKNFDLTVNANGGVWTGTTPQTLDYGESLTIANPTKDGYTFSGWTLTGNDSALIGNTFTMGSENATLTANWTVRTDLEYTVYYKLEETLTDIQSPNTITNKTFGETYTETAPVIAGYEKLDTTKDVLITTGTNEIMFYYRAIANITASVTSTSSSGSSIVSYGDIITYTLTGTNTGTGAGNLTAKDLLLMAELSGLDVELIDTGLTASEIADRNALLSNSGLIKTINAGDTYTLVFRVRVLGNAGSSISNKLTYNVGSDPELTDTLKNYNIEKTMSLRAISEIGVNVVLTLDISGSMEGSKFSSMKSAATTFIDTIFPSGVDNEGTEICVVTFSKPWWDLFGNNAMLRGCTGGSGAKTPAQLKSIINGLETGSSTPYTSALSVVSDTLDSMENRNTDNDNIVVFLSDGEPTDGNGYIATANALKASGTVIYSIGFEVTGSAETTLRSLATSSSYYYTGTVSNIESVFSNIASEISTESKRSVNGVVEISNVNTTKVIEFKVNGSTSGYPTTVANALSQGYLINNGTTYSIDLTKFNASSSIVFTYYKN